MNLFLPIIAVLLALVILYLLRALRQHSVRTADRVELSKILYTQRITELKSDLEIGNISEEQHLKARQELDKQLLDDTSLVEGELRSLTPKQIQQFKLSLVLGLPVLSLVLYLMTADLRVLTTKPILVDNKDVPGSKQAIKAKKDKQTQANATGSGQPPPFVLKMVKRVEERLKKNPNNIEDWKKLLKSYRVLKRYPDAIRAMREIVKRSPNNALVLVNLAVVIAESRKQDYRGEPADLLRKALKMDKNLTKALIALGLSHYQSKEYKQAIELFTRAKKNIKPNTFEEKFINAFIEKARKSLKTP